MFSTIDQLTANPHHRLWLLLGLIVNGCYGINVEGEKGGRKLLQFIEGGNLAEYGVIVLFVVMIAGLLALWCCSSAPNPNEGPQNFRTVFFTDGTDQPFLSMDDFYSGEEDDPVAIIKQNYKNQGQLLLRRVQSFPYKPSENFKEHTECLICLEEFKEGDLITAFPCLHQFHSQCIKEWVEEKGYETICPTCQLNLKEMLDSQDEQNIV